MYVKCSVIFPHTNYGIAWEDSGVFLLVRRPQNIVQNQHYGILLCEKTRAANTHAMFIPTKPERANIDPRGSNVCLPCDMPMSDSM